MAGLLLPPAVSALLKGLKDTIQLSMLGGGGELFKYPGFVWVSVPGTGLKGVGAKGRRSRRGREREAYGGQQEKPQADITQASQREMSMPMTDKCMWFPGMELTEANADTTHGCCPSVARPPTGLGLLSLG